MKRGEYIATASAVFFMSMPANSQNAEMAHDKAIMLADELEENPECPWKEAPKAPALEIPCAALEVGTPSQVKAILNSVLQGMPAEAGLPPGRWELVFRKTETPSGIIPAQSIPANYKKPVD